MMSHTVILSVLINLLYWKVSVSMISHTVILSVLINLLESIKSVLEMPVKNQLQGMLAVFEPLDRAQSKKNFEPSFVKIG